MMRTQEEARRHRAGRSGRGHRRDGRRRHRSARSTTAACSSRSSRATNATPTRYQVIARLRPQLDKVAGRAGCSCKPRRTSHVGGRPSRTQFQYTLQDADLDELNAWAPSILAKLKTLPELRDVATDQQTSGTTLTLSINRDTASRFGITPQLIDDTLYDALASARSRNTSRSSTATMSMLEVLPSLQDSPDSLQNIYVKSPTRAGRCRWPPSPHGRPSRSRPLSINHQGQFPAVTISFNLAPDVALGRPPPRSRRPSATCRSRRRWRRASRATAQAFQESLSTVPLLILAALFVVYLILGVLYESFIHPITILSTLPSAGVGALAVLLWFGYDFSLIALIGIILLIGIVKKNGIMLVDFAIVAERRAQPRAGGGDPAGGPAAVPPDPDDDDGGAARRRAADDRHGTGSETSSAPRLRDGRRLGRQPDPDACSRRR